MDLVDLELSVLTKPTDLAIFGSEMKVCMSGEVPECTEIDRKATRGIEETTKVDQNYLKYISWILGC